MKIKKPTQKEKIKMYEEVLHDLHFASSVVMNHQQVMDILQKISSWSYAHRVGNGEHSEAQQQKIVNKAFWALNQTTK